MKILAYVLAFLALAALLMLIAGCSRKSESLTSDPSTANIVDPIYPDMQWRKAYETGFRDALEAAALLDLEQHLTGTNRNWGQMFDVLTNRFGVTNQWK